MPTFHFSQEQRMSTSNRRSAFGLFSGFVLAATIMLPGNVYCQMSDNDGLPLPPRPAQRTDGSSKANGGEASPPTSDGEGQPLVIQDKVVPRGLKVLLSHQSASAEEERKNPKEEEEEEGVGGMAPNMNIVLEGMKGLTLKSKTHTIGNSYKGRFGTDSGGDDDDTTSEQNRLATANTVLWLIGEVTTSKRPVKITVTVKEVKYLEPTVDDESANGQKELAVFKGELGNTSARLKGSTITLTDEQRNKLLLDGQAVRVDFPFQFFEEEQTAQIILSTSVKTECKKTGQAELTTDCEHP